MTHVTISDPDDPTAMPIYDGPLADINLIAGSYEGTDLDGQPVTVHVPDDDREPRIEQNAWIDHTGDGTLVHNTDRDDTTMRAALKQAGFKWSRNLDAWYLPRTWTWPTRTMRARQLVGALEQQGRSIDVHENRERERSSAEIAAERQERAEARADRYVDRAAQASAQADATHTEAEAMADRIPFGQPILVGHHSENRDRRYRQRIADKMDRTIENQRKADHYAGRAQTAARTAQGDTDPAKVARRIERLEADRRRVQRTIDGTDPVIPDPPATGERLTRLEAEAADLDEQLAYNRDLLARLEAERGRLWAPSDLRKGDMVRIRGQWRRVVRVNRKTVSVETGYSWTDTVPYSEISGRLRDGETLRHPPEPEESSEDVVDRISRNMELFAGPEVIL